MNLFQKYRLARQAKIALHAIRSARHWRADVATPADLHAAATAEAALRLARHTRNWTSLPLATTAATAATAKLYPPRPFPAWRENVELLIVALSLAMACRTYFIQPFKIPTGSMQPTLNGITAAPQDAPAWYDHFPARLIPLALFGERYLEIRTPAPGRVERDYRTGALRVAGRIHPIPTSFHHDSPQIDPAHSLHTRVSPGERIPANTILASGRTRFGDHVFVNKLAYHFSRPKRGDIIVFDTNAIDAPSRARCGIAANTFYIKRLAGLPGETIAIVNGRLHANGHPVTSPPCFNRLATHPAYSGYVLRPGSLLQKPQDSIPIPPHHFLPLGDNTYSSLDGRYFGPVPTTALVGPAFFVYWPFRPHFGFI